VASIQHRPERARPWRVAWRDDSGRQRSQSFARKVDASRFRAKVEHELHTGRYVDPHAGKITVAEVAAEWLDRQTFDVATRIAVESRLRVHVLPTLGPVELRALKPSGVQGWVRMLSRDRAPSYVALLLGHLKSVLAAAVDDGIIATNPAASRSVKPPKVEQRRVVPWTVTQVRAIADAHPDRYQALVVLAAGTGLRQGELFGLAVDDVDFLRRTVHVRKQVRLLNGHPVYAPPKSGREREVPLPETAAVALSEHLRRFPSVEVTLPWVDRDGPPTARTLVFTGPKGASLNKNPHTQRVWIPALADAGIDYVPRESGMHQLRHHYASVLLDASVSIAALASYLGHADPSVTLRVYSHLMPDTEDRARQAVDAAHGVAQVLPKVTRMGD
jgi:integrase